MLERLKRIGTGEAAANVCVSEAPRITMSTQVAEVTSETIATLVASGVRSAVLHALSLLSRGNPDVVHRLYVCGKGMLPTVGQRMCIAGR